MADGESKPKHKPKADFDARATAEMEQHLAVPDWSLRQKLALTARMLATLAAGGPSGQVFWNEKPYPLMDPANDQPRVI